MRLFILCGFGWSADVGEIRLIGFLLDGHTLEFELTAGERWVLSAVLFLGMFIGAWFWGLVADRFGRKHAFTATCALTFTFGAGSALSDSAAALAACRFGAPAPPWLPASLQLSRAGRSPRAIPRAEGVALGLCDALPVSPAAKMRPHARPLLRAAVGVGLGGNLAVDFSMFLEYLPSAYRGRAMVYLTGWSAVGNIWASALAWAIIPSYGWRPYVVLCAAPLLPAMILRLRVKESPRYLLISGLPAEAAEVICDIARGNKRASQLPPSRGSGKDAAPGFTLAASTDAGTTRAARGSVRLLCSGPILRSLLPMCAIW